MSHHIPLAVLLVLSLVGGFIALPLAGMFPEPSATHDGGAAWAAHVPLVVSLAGIALSWLLFLRAPQIPAALARSPATAWIGAIWRNAWGFDWIYDRLFVRPFVWLAQVNRNDTIDRVFSVVPAGLRGLSAAATMTQNGNLRWYAAVAAAGLCALIALVAFT